MPSNGKIIKDVVPKSAGSYDKCQRGGRQKTYEGLKNDYLSLKAILTSLGVNLTDIDKMKE